MSATLSPFPTRRPAREPPTPPAFAELVAASHFSFLRGASPGAELVLQALILGQSGLGIADRNTLAGVVRPYAALKEWREGGALPPLQHLGTGRGEFAGASSPQDDDIPEALRDLLRERAKRFKLLAGARLVFADGTPDIVAYPETRQGWGGLCRLLTLGNRRAKKGECLLTLDDLLAEAKDLALILMPERRNDVRPFVSRLSEAFPQALWLGATMPRHGDDRRRLHTLMEWSRTFGVPLLATNDALYATPDSREVQDILTCIREGVKIEAAGRLLEMNAERHLKSPVEMARLFADYPQALAAASALLERVSFSLSDLRYDYPDEPVPEGWEAQSWLEELTFRSARTRYAGSIPPKVEALLRQELALIARLGYARYFLTIHDLVETARAKGILCQGRGSAANSAVCYVLGITCVDPNEHNVLFARFISEERKEPPDIDVDFEHERREEIIQYLYQKYGRHRAGLAGTVISYRPKSAIREVGKALGLSDDITGALSRTQWGSFGSKITQNQVIQAGLDPANAQIARAVRLAKRILGFPRHLSQHVGGFVLTRGRLDELVPIGNAAMAERTFIEWDKDDIDTLGLMKVDVLALGMLTCIRKAFDYLRASAGIDWGLADVPADDPATYAMLQKGDSVGVFQVESRAQMNMLPRLKPRVFYDLVIQVAIVRPGPIQGNMVHPYLRRRSGIEQVAFPSPAAEHGPPDELHNVLGKTMGVPLFQEQAMQLAMVAAKFSDVEANQLRRAMATFRNIGTIHLFETMMVERMVGRGYERQFAQNCFEQIKGFGSYGFPESHAASFAKLVYISSYIKCHYPAIFAAALLNSQPMGFYAPAQIVRDAAEHGVTIRPADINASFWDNSLEPDGAGGLALRLGFRQIDGFREADGRRLAERRGDGFSSIEGLARRADLEARALRLLADADALGSLKLDRRQALWEVRRLPDDTPLPLFAAAKAAELGEEEDARLPIMGFGEEVASDYQTMRLSLKAHPMAILRSVFATEKVTRCADLAELRDGQTVKVAGLVLVRQRPGKGNAIFITLEDESGIANLVLWTSLFERLRRPVMGARLMLARGQVQKSADGVIHVMARDIIDRSQELSRLWDTQTAPPSGMPAPLLSSLSPPRASHPRHVRVLHKSRDFH